MEQYARQHHGSRLDERELIYIMKQIFRSLLYLRMKKIVHRDIKCENFLIEPREKLIKMIDFGTAVVLQNA